MNQHEMKTLFENIGQKIFSELSTGEQLSLALHGEESHFLRFNHSKVRQQTLVEQWDVGLVYQTANQKIELSVQIGKDEQDSYALLKEALQYAQEEAPLLPKDPYLSSFKNEGNSCEIHQNIMPDQHEFLALIQECLSDSDMTGIASFGPIFKGLINSEGLSHWFETQSFSFDYSLYQNHKAVKNVYAPSKWDVNKLREQFKQDKKALEVMQRPKRKVSPGRYRCYLGPQAMADIVGRMSWGSFSYGETQKGASPLYKLWKKEKSFSPLVHMAEDFSAGLAPRFNERGQLPPEKLSLIQEGQIKDLLTSQRSSLEYNVESNKASEHESPQALILEGGNLDEQKALQELGTGLYLSNLHYINWSDLPNARMTGMTRFACFWVEDGEIIAPIEDMRFDETLYSCLGENLIDLTTTAHLSPNLSTYYARGLGGVRSPGALLKEFNLTL